MVVRAMDSLMGTVRTIAAVAGCRRRWKSVARLRRSADVGVCNGVVNCGGRMIGRDMVVLEVGGGVAMLLFACRTKERGVWRGMTSLVGVCLSVPRNAPLVHAP